MHVHKPASSTHNRQQTPRIRQPPLQANQAQNANNIAQNATGQEDKRLNTEVSNLDQYKQISDVEIPFRGGSPVLTEDARGQLDQIAANLAGQHGYIIEMEARAPGAGSAGIQSSQRLAESIQRYLVTEHQIPVLIGCTLWHLGNTPPAAAEGDDSAKPEREFARAPFTSV